MGGLRGPFLVERKLIQVSYVSKLTEQWRYRLGNHDRRCHYNLHDGSVLRTEIHGEMRRSRRDSLAYCISL